MKKENDLLEILNVFIFAASVTLVLYYIFEFYNPYVDEKELYKVKCNNLGGVVLEVQNQGTMCVKKEGIIESV